MYATAAVMKLVDEGKVDLDAPVVRYVPDFKMKDGRYKRITPRMLLNHSSGLQGSTLGNAFYLTIMIPMPMIPCYSNCQIKT